MIRRWLIAGLLVWVPLGACIFIAKFFIDLFDRSLLLVPADWRPEAILGFSIPGLGAVFCLILLLLTGAIVANIAGRRLLRLGEHVLDEIPFIRSIYYAVKRVTETVLTADEHSFRQVFLVEYPRRGVWALGFQTGTTTGEIQQKIGGDAGLLTLFIPTTPNPTSGVIIFASEEDVTPLDMSVEEGLQMIISLGVMTPEQKAELVDPEANL